MAGQERKLGDFAQLPKRVSVKIDELDGMLEQAELKSDVISVKVSPRLKEAALRRAHAEGTTLTQKVTEMLQDWIKQE